MRGALGIVIPAYRPDVQVLSTYVRSLDDALDPTELVVELDAPRSEEVVEEIRRTPATVNAFPQRRGKGAAITAGFETLDSSIRMFLDADGATPVSSATAILSRIRDGSADVSVGSRRHRGAEIVSHQTPVRRYLGDAFAWMARRMLPTELFDYQCGAKAITAEVWRGIRSHLYERGFAWDLELVAIAGALGYEIAEIPVTWEDQPGSTVNPIAAVGEFSRTLLTVRHRSFAIQGNPIHETLPRSHSEPLIETTRGD